MKWKKKWLVTKRRQEFPVSFVINKTLQLMIVNSSTNWYQNSCMYFPVSKREKQIKLISHLNILNWMSSLSTYDQTQLTNQDISWGYFETLLNYNDSERLDTTHFHYVWVYIRVHNSAEITCVANSYTYI